MLRDDPPARFIIACASFIPRSANGLRSAIGNQRIRRRGTSGDHGLVGLHALVRAREARANELDDPVALCRLERFIRIGEQ